MTDPTHSTGNDQWYTPPWVLDVARATMGGPISFDPASCALANETVGARQYYDGANADGLEDDWPVTAKRVWLNPPYSRAAGGVGAWLARLADYVREDAGRTGCALVNASTGAAWFHDHVWGELMACAIWFPRGRISFIDRAGVQQSSPTKYNALILYGMRSRAHHLAEATRPHGGRVVRL